MTAVAVVAIAAVAVVFSTLIWPSIKVNIINSTKCAQAHACSTTGKNKNTRTCYYLNDEGKEEEVECPNSDDSSGGNTSGTGGSVPGDNFQEQDHMR